LLRVSTRSFLGPSRFVINDTVRTPAKMALTEEYVELRPRNPLYMRSTARLFRGKSERSAPDSSTPILSLNRLIVHHDHTDLGTADYPMVLWHRS